MGHSEMHVERIQDGYQHCGQEEKVHLRVGLGARERTQVRIINRIDAEVGDKVGPCADERLPLREVQPMVYIKHGRRDEEEGDSPLDPRFGAVTVPPDEPENAPKETEHHRQRYDPLV